MKTKGSKSVLTKQPKPSTIPTAESDQLGTVTIPDAAPAPPKPTRKKKAEPTLAVKPDVPEWVRKAEAGPPLANATTTESAPEPEAPAPPSPKKGRAAKAPKPKPAPKEMPSATPGSLRAIGNAWLDALRADGHTPATVSSYGNDLGIAYEHLGADTAADEITERQIAAFNGCKGVTKKANGKAKAQPTILKTRRALRLALTWAEEMKLIKKAPYSAA